MELQFLGFELGKDYPHPIVSISKMRKFASDALYAYKKSPKTRLENKRIIAKHTLPGRPVWDQHN